MPDKELKGYPINVPDKCVNRIKLAVQDFNGPKNTEGYKRAINIIKNPVIRMGLLKKINNFFRNTKEGEPSYNLTGGDYCKKVFNELETQLRDGKSTGRKSKMDAGMTNTHYGEHEKDGNANPTQVTVPAVDKANTLRESIKKINKLINY
tara:strand:- start:193 stop:642 length:450 start_codon:yes stop_codon:yes gene_type:complete